MPFFFLYLIKLSLGLAAVFLFYHFLLRRLTFYNWNRWFLAGYTLLSFFIPFIDISPVLDKYEWAGSEAVNWVPVINHTVEAAPASPVEQHLAFSIWPWLMILVFTGVLLLMSRLLYQYISYRRMLKNATLLSTGDLQIYQVDAPIIPFSFGQSIFINPDLHSETELQEIIRHEIVHVRQKHSRDIIWGEILCLLNWYNPFAWLIKKAIRQNLEFIADNQVIENGVNKKAYQYLLLKVMGNHQYSIATQFNFSSLKKRIAMMNRLKSTKVHLVKFLFVLPLAGLLLVAFRNASTDNHFNSKETTGLSGILSKEKAMAGPHQPMQYNFNDTTPAKTEFALPDNVTRIGINNKKATVQLKNGQTETYNLNSEKEKKEFEKKYGDIPPPPPPVPPLPPIKGPAPIAPLPPLPPLPPVASGSAELGRVANHVEINNQQAVIKLKNGQTETYDLTNKKEKRAFEKKYGNIIQAESTVSAKGYNVVSPGAAVTVISDNVVTTAPVVAVSAKKGGSGTAATTVIAAGKNNDAAYSIYTTPAAVQGYGTAFASPVSVSTGRSVDDENYKDRGTENILVTITNKTTDSQLKQYIADMKERGIELAFDEIEYDNQHNLVKISGSMKSKENHSSFVAVEFKKLILSLVIKGEKTWFSVRTTDGKIHS